jgi:hypothetical protein
MSGAPGAVDANAWLGGAPPRGDSLIVNKRYRLADPATGEQRDYTRVSTLLACLGSSHGLTIWQERGIIEGLALRPDLRALLASAPGDKAVADEVLAAAKEASGLHAARRHGTAVHGALERTLLGQPLALADDEPVAGDLAAVLALIEGEGLRVRRVELVVLHSTLGYAGRLDLLVEVDLPDGRTVVRVADLKTGKDVGIGDKARKIAAQLAAYARCTHVRLEDGTLVEVQRSGLSIDTEVGYVISVRDGVAELLEADLSSGWTDVLLAAKEHQRAAAARKLAMLPVGRRYVAPTPAAATVLDDLRAAVTASADPLVEQIIEQAPPLPVEVEKTATGRARPKCSRCRQSGHRARTCTADVAPEPKPQIIDADGGPAVEYVSSPPGPDAPPAQAFRTPESIGDVVSAQLACICTHAPGWSMPDWTPRPDVTVCSACGWPSAATVERLTSERAGLASVVPRVEPLVTPVEAPATQDVGDLIKRAVSQAELADVWQAAVAAGAWTDAHTALATERAPSLPPTSDLPF